MSEEPKDGSINLNKFTDLASLLVDKSLMLGLRMTVGHGLQDSDGGVFLKFLNKLDKKDRLDALQALNTVLGTKAFNMAFKTLDNDSSTLSNGLKKSLGDDQFQKFKTFVQEARGVKPPSLMEASGSTYYQFQDGFGYINRDPWKDEHGITVKYYSDTRSYDNELSSIDSDFQNWLVQSGDDAFEH